MTMPEEHIEYVRSTIAHLPVPVELTVVREEVRDQFGFYRYRLSFPNGDLVELVERFSVRGGHVELLKYRFHWQDADGRIIAR